VALDERGEIAGAALLLGGPDVPPLLDMLFVAPSLQGRGVATAMAAAACAVLQDTGASVLDSRFVQGNDASEAWHRRFGFVELPDLTLARDRYRGAQHERWRRGKLGDLDTAEREALDGEVERLRRHVVELEARAEAEGWESVDPMLRR
jgi:GNAT superfamily N-acetyltransferase